MNMSGVFQHVSPSKDFGSLYSSSQGVLGKSMRLKIMESGEGYENNLEDVLRVTKF